MKSAKALIDRFRTPDSSRDAELAFLPAALEIVETPPAPLVGMVGGTIIALFSIALIWSFFGHIDIVASAPGKIIPSSRTKVIQPFETGVVRAIRVRDGEEVKAGQVLVELDPTINEAERNHLRGDLITAELDAARLTAALDKGANRLAAFQPPADASPSLVNSQRDFLIHQIDEQEAKLAALDRQKAQKEAELSTINATIAKLGAILPVLRQRVDIREVLFSHQTGSKANFLEIQQALVETEQDLLVQKSKAKEAEAAVAALIEAKVQTAAEYARTRSGELVEAQRKVAALSEDLVKAERKTKLQVLASPVDGTVQQLSIHTVGGVVTPAQTLLVVVPAENHLEIEAMISNRDIGFVHVGQDVEIKVDTFNFTRYGLIHGKVTSVSRDAIANDRQQERPGEAPSRSSNTNASQELNYAARISLDRTQMQIDENLVDLSPGMAVTAEIKTGSRAVIGYLLSPLLKYRQESLRER
jgi:hemolysin D